MLLTFGNFIVEFSRFPQVSQYVVTVDIDPHSNKKHDKS